MPENDSDKPKGDRLWLILSVLTGVAVDVTLNKYSSVLPGLVVLLVWAVPLVLLIVWGFRFEQRTGTIRGKFKQHPISYLLILILLIPIFVYSTALMCRSIWPITSAQKVPPPSIAPATSPSVMSETKPQAPLPSEIDTPEQKTPQNATPSRQEPKKSPTKPTKQEAGQIPQASASVPPTSAQQGPTIGSESTVLGIVPPGTKVGDKSVYMGATDSNGNAIYKQPGAYGYDAHAGPGSIAVGAHAGAGMISPPDSQQSINAPNGIAIGGSAQVQNPTVNNYGPIERHLTQAQKDGLVALATKIPKNCTVFFGSGDAGEQQAFAREMHDIWATTGTTRDPGWIFGWHPKGIFLQVKSAGEPCAKYGQALVDGFKDIGLPIAGTSVNSRLGSDSELQVLIGDR
jgi:hypothetical protein